MGLFSRAKEAVTGGSTEEDDGVDIDDDFIETDETIESEEANEPDPEPEPEPEQMEWDNAYDFAGWALEERGFPTVKDGAEKAAYDLIKDDPMFRDRFQTGMETLTQVQKAKASIDEITGSDSSGSSYSEVADELEDADRVIKSLRSLSGEDEMLVQQGMSITRDVLSAVASDGSGGQSNMNASMETDNSRIE